VRKKALRGIESGFCIVMSCFLCNFGKRKWKRILLTSSNNSSFNSFHILKPSEDNLIGESVINKVVAVARNIIKLSKVGGGIRKMKTGFRSSVDSNHTSALSGGFC
jgi:hypothetical protein